jgi:hypothetical protein
MIIWYILRSFGRFFRFLKRTEKNLAALKMSAKKNSRLQIKRKKASLKTIFRHNLPSSAKM